MRLLQHGFETQESNFLLREEIFILHFASPYVLFIYLFTNSFLLLLLLSFFIFKTLL